MNRLVRLVATLLPVCGAIAPAVATTPSEPAAQLAEAPKSNLGEKKYWEAIRLLENGSPADLGAGREALQAAANLEYPHAQALLAECLLNGQYGFSINKSKAANLFRLSAERGNAFAKVSLGQCLFFGIGVFKDREKAAEWFKASVADNADYSRPVPPAGFQEAAAQRSATQENIAGALETDPAAESRASAHFFLGLLCAQKKQLDEAQKHFVEAARAGRDGRSGVYMAAVEAATNYAFGRGVPRDPVKANEMLSISKKLSLRGGVRLIHHYATAKAVDDFAAADLEDDLRDNGDKAQSSIQIGIADIFTQKGSKDYNPAEAEKWYLFAAENGNVDAMLRLAFLYSGNELGAPAPDKAFTWIEKAGSGETPKHILGLINLLICVNNGIGTPKDPAKAAMIIEKYKNQNFICYLASTGACPTHILTAEEVMKTTESWAKDKKDPMAQYFLGMHYRYGWDGKTDMDAAIKWFKKAAANNSGPAWAALGTLHEFTGIYFRETREESVEQARICYKKGIALNDPESMASYAASICAENERDPLVAEEARDLYLRCLSLDPENVQANNNIAVIYESRARDRDNRNPDEDKALMFKHYEAALKGKMPLAARNLALIYSDNILVRKDLTKSYRYMEQAAELGLSSAHCVLGQINEDGFGVPVSYAEAAYHYRLAALDGNQLALRKLIDLYSLGKMGAVDFDRAMFWLDKLIQTGDTDAFTKIADIMLARKEYKKAIELLKALEQDEMHPNHIGFAAERLSRCYENGWGVKPDAGKAKRYFEEAIGQSDGDALSRKAMKLLEQGDTTEAVDLLIQASRYSAEACYQLGRVYWEGKYVPKNLRKAGKFYGDAAKQGHADALYILAETALGKGASLQTIEIALRMASQAEALGLEKAKALREKLEALQSSRTHPEDQEDTTRERSS
jgi:TPR repeat protein